MKKSFKLRVYLHTILAAAIIIYGNRLTAQYFLEDQLQTRIHQEMGVGLQACSDHFEKPDAFLSCFKAIEKGSLFSSISDFYVLCDRSKNTANTTSACQPLLADVDFWRSDAVSRAGDIEFSRGLVGDQRWYAVRFSNRSKGAEVWLAGEEIHALLLRVWALRDRNTIYTLPTILASLLGLMLYLTRVVMRPLISIQNNMAQLTANTLDQSIALKAP